MASLVELRVLEGPNLYFPRAAIKLTLDISGLADVSTEKARAGDRDRALHIASGSVRLGRDR